MEVLQHRLMFLALVVLILSSMATTSTTTVNNDVTTERPSVTTANNDATSAAHNGVTSATPSVTTVANNDVTTATPSMTTTSNDVTTATPSVPTVVNGDVTTGATTVLTNMPTTTMATTTTLETTSVSTTPEATTTAIETTTHIEKVTTQKATTEPETTLVMSSTPETTIAGEITTQGKTTTVQTSKAPTTIKMTTLLETTTLDTTSPKTTSQTTTLFGEATTTDYVVTSEGASTLADTTTMGEVTTVSPKTSTPKRTTTAFETTEGGATTIIDTTSSMSLETSTKTEVQSTSTSLVSTPESTAGITTTVSADNQTTIKVIMTTANQNTTIIPNCTAGFFGPTCSFWCLCVNASEACDVVSGQCQSGCPLGFTGPGCSLPIWGDEPVVIMLGILLTLTLLFDLGLLGILVRTLRQQAYAQSAEKHAYDSPVLESADAKLQEAEKIMAATKKDKNEEGPGPDNLPRIPETDIQVHTDPLGEGRFGDILPGRIHRGKKRIEVAFKTIKDGATWEERTALIAQLQLYNKLQVHENVIHFYGVCTVGDQIFAAFEYADNGNLRNYLRHSSMAIDESESESSGILDEGLMISFCMDVAQGMAYLESKKIVHRELMALHVMVSKTNTCKIAGLNPPSNNNVQNKLVRWLSPESLQEGIFNHKSDVWSYGILMWEVMSQGDQPYPGVASKELENLITGTYRMPVPDNCSLEIYDIMRKCWEEDPDGRPSFSDILDRMNLILELINDTTIYIEDGETVA